MIRLLAVGATIFGALAAGAAEVVPSGQKLELREVLIDEVGVETWIRFQFLAPEIARGTGTITYQQAADDLPHLCETVALPYVAEHGLQGEVVVITLQDRPVPFGQGDPDATQYIDAYRIQSGACIWEAF